MDLKQSIELVENSINSCSNLAQLEVSKGMMDTFIFNRFSNLSVKEIKSIYSRFKNLVDKKLEQLNEL